MFFEYTVSTYDQIGVPGTSIEDIDLLRVEQYFRNVHGLELEEERQVVPLEKLLINSGILTFVENKALVTVGGILVFGKSPESALYASGILAVRYRGAEVGEILDKRDLSGVIPKLAVGWETRGFRRKGRELKTLSLLFECITSPR